LPLCPATTHFRSIADVIQWLNGNLPSCMSWARYRSQRQGHRSLPAPDVPKVKAFSASVSLLKVGRELPD